MYKGHNSSGSIPCPRNRIAPPITVASWLSPLRGQHTHCHILTLTYLLSNTHVHKPTVTLTHHPSHTHTAVLICKFLQPAGTCADTACGGAPGRASWPPRPRPPGARLPRLPQGPTQEKTPKLSTDQQVHRDSASKARSGQWQWRIRAPALPPSQGCSPRLVALLPSSAPLYVTMANPHVVLCTAEVPQGVRASWGGWAVG